MLRSQSVVNGGDITKSSITQVCAYAVMGTKPAKHKTTTVVENDPTLWFATAVCIMPDRHHTFPTAVELVYSGNIVWPIGRKIGTQSGVSFPLFGNRHFHCAGWKRKYCVTVCWPFPDGSIEQWAAR